MSAETVDNAQFNASPVARSLDEPRRRRLKAAARGLVSLALLATVIASVGDEALWESLTRGARRWYLLIPAFFVPSAVGYLLAVLRLSALLRTQQIRVAKTRILRALLVGTFFNQLLPTSVGGDAYSVWYISKQAGQLPAVLAAVFVGRLMGVMAMCMLAIGGAALSPVWFARIPELRYCVIVLGVILIAIVWVLARIRPPATEPAPGRLGIYRKWHRLATALERFRSHRYILIKAMGYSLALQTEIVLQYWLFGWLLGVDLPFARFLVAVPLVSLAAMLPISLNGVGVREWVMIWICTPLGIVEADAAMIAMLFIVPGLCYAVLGAVIFNRSPHRRGSGNEPLS